MVVAVTDELGDPAQLGILVVEHEDLLQQGNIDLDRPEIDDRSAAIRCHAGGTTGLPTGTALAISVAGLDGTISPHDGGQLMKSRCGALG